VKSITFVDVKTGAAGLNQRQRQINDERAGAQEVF
jgi:hypothetical protein